jgi:hypothetical protein
MGWDIGCHRVEFSRLRGRKISLNVNLKLDADNPADREKLRRAVLDLVAGRKMPKQKGRG